MTDRAEQMREAAARVAQDFHEKAIEWAKTVRGLEKHIGETDSSRIAAAIRALPLPPQPPLADDVAGVVERLAREKAEAEVARLREVLREIKDCTSEHGGAAKALRIIRAALTPKGADHE